MCVYLKISASLCLAHSRSILEYAERVYRAESRDVRSVARSVAAAVDGENDDTRGSLCGRGRARAIVRAARERSSPRELFIAR